MADVHSKKTRSYNMSKISGKNTKPEILVRRYLHSKGFRFRLHSKSLIGKPDIVLPKYRTVVFVHGCFWHSHQGCKYFKLPKTRTEFWANKLAQNKIRDIQVAKALTGSGWNVYEVWECELKAHNCEETLNNLIDFLRKDATLVPR